MWVKCVTGINNSEVFTVKRVYEVKLIDNAIMLITADNGKEVEIEKCTHVGKKGEFSFYQPAGGFSWFAFAEVGKPKYATRPEVLAQVFRKQADNVEKGLEPCEGIQFKVEGDVWCRTREVNQLEEFEYRVKPDTYTLKNGVEIPKPLDVSEIEDDGHYYHVANYKMLAYEDHGASIKKDGVLFVYKTREEAIEASKALFGLEITDV